jgi:beta-glucosidase
MKSKNQTRQLMTKRVMTALLVVLTTVVGTEAVTTTTPLYLDSNQPIDKRVDDLVSRMALEEKASLMFHGAPAIQRLGVPEFHGWNQCLHGVVWSEPTTMFPVSTALAATWDTSLVHEVASTISDEARAIYNLWHKSDRKVRRNGLVYRAPVINISRDPRWGRINECYGEDPYLTSRLGVAFVKGLQGDDPKYLKLVSTLKHYAVNNQEHSRQSLSAEVPERMLMEYWLPHFKTCIVEGQAQSIMAAYNAINGMPCVVNKFLLTDILKEQWEFNGFVVSDTGGIKSLVQQHRWAKTFEEGAAMAVLAGCDLDDDEYMKCLPAAVKEGLVSEQALNRAVSRVLLARFRLGEFDPPEMVPYSKISPDEICSPRHRQLALQAAREAIVLMSNREHFLPLNRKKLKSIAVIGPHANVFTAGGYSGKASDPVTPLQGIRNRASQGIEILYAKGCEILEPDGKEPDFREAVAIAGKTDVAILFVGTDLQVETEGRDRRDLDLPGSQEDLIKMVHKANPRTVVVLMNAGPLAVKWAKQNVPAIIEAWWDGEEGGNAIADVLFGDYNPGGKLPYTIYESVNQLPSQSEYDITKGFTYMYFQDRPLFPFGHGLSYTRFGYSNLQITPKQVPADGKVSISVEVRNIGERAGDEVVQLYVHDVACSVKRPVKELRGFERIHLKPGEKRTMTFELPGEKLSFYDVKQHRFVTEPGAFDVLVGSSSADISVRGRFTVQAVGKTCPPNSLGRRG